MKYINLILALTIGTSCFAQTQVAAVDSPETNILYRGYANKLIPAVSNNNGNRIGLQSSNAKIRAVEDQSYFYVTPGNGNECELDVVLINENGKSEIIRTIEYQVYNLPSPYVYWGKAKNGTKADIKSTELFVKYAPGIPLNIDFEIISWKISLNGETISGVGSNLLAAEDFLKNVPNESHLMMEVAIKGEDGVTRFRNASWEVNAWKLE